MSYDRNLLRVAAQLEQGYNVEPSRGSSAQLIPQLAPASVMPGVAESGPEEKPTTSPAASTSKPSFWRSRNSIIAIAIIALVVIGAVVGGAVGGTAKKNSNSNVVAPTLTSTVISSSPITSIIGQNGQNGQNGYNGGLGLYTTTTVPPTTQSSSGPPTATTTVPVSTSVQAAGASQLL